MTKNLGLAIYAGGNHVFYIAGLIKYFQEQGLKFDVLATYSSGAAITPYILNNNIDDAIKVFKDLTKDNKKNFYFSNLFSKSKPALPHNYIYSTAIEQSVERNNFPKNTPCRVITSGFKGNRYITATSAFIIIMMHYLTYNFNKNIFFKLFKKVFNIKANIIELNNLSNKQDISNVIIGTSTIPPFIKIRRFNNLFMLDGAHSLITPIDALDDCENVLVINTNHVHRVTRSGVIQISPINKITENPLNYAGSQSFLNIFNQGYAEAPIHYEKIKDSDFFKKS